MESKDIVRGTLEEDGMLLVSFANHDGYFRAPLAAAALCQQIREACKKRSVVCFTFDRELKIESMRSTTGWPHDAVCFRE